MEDLKEFIAWLEKYLSEGHDVVGVSAVIYELKKILSSLEDEEFIRRITTMKFTGKELSRLCLCVRTVIRNLEGELSEIEAASADTTNIKECIDEYQALYQKTFKTMSRTKKGQN